MSHHDEQLPSIDLDSLDNVTGGVTSTSSSATNAQLTTALQGISSSLKDLGSNTSNSSNGLQSMLPFLLMARGGGGGGGGACPCGCGMANCIRR